MTTIRRMPFVIVIAVGIGCGAALARDDGLRTADSCTREGCRTWTPDSSSSIPSNSQKPTGPVAQMCRLDQKNIDYAAEIRNQRRAIEAMHRRIEESKLPGSSFPDINKLKEQGKVGIGGGVVGAGKKKPKAIRDKIVKYESPLNV